MTFDMFEAGGLDTVKFDLQGKMTALRSGFESSLESKYDAFMKMPDSVDGNAAHWLGIDTADAAADLAALRTEVMSWRSKSMKSTASSRRFPKANAQWSGKRKSMKPKRTIWKWKKRHWPNWRRKNIGFKRNWTRFAKPKRKSTDWKSSFPNGKFT